MSPLIIFVEVVCDGELAQQIIEVPSGADLLDAIDEAFGREIEIVLKVEELETRMNLLPSIFWGPGDD